MKNILTRSLSGLLYVLLLVFSLFNEYSLIILFFVFGITSLYEFKKLVKLKSITPYIIFGILYSIFGYWQLIMHSNKGLAETTLILAVLTILVLFSLIKDLLSEKTISLSNTKRYIYTTFYVSSAYIFLILIAKYYSAYNPNILLGSFILIWVNDTFAFLVGSQFGKRKLFESVSPKKTVEGFIGGLFFACVASYFIAIFTETLNFTQWLILSVIISVFGTLGDLVESKFKRQAKVKDSGAIMPGHGGILDRFDSIIFAAPFIYLFLRILQYVS